jgi:hypothetical protein
MERPMLKNEMSITKKRTKSLNSPRTPPIMVTIGLKVSRILINSRLLYREKMRLPIIIYLEVREYGVEM